MITWYEDNSMRITQTVDGSGDEAEVTATILDADEQVVGDPITLDPTGTDGEYAITVHPTGDYDLTGGATYRLRVVATYGGATLETEESFKPRVRRSA